MQKKLLVVTELFDIVVNDFDAKKSARCSRMFVVTYIIVSGPQCKSNANKKLLRNTPSPACSDLS